VKKSEKKSILDYNFYPFPTLSTNDLTSTILTSKRGRWDSSKVIGVSDDVFDSALAKTAFSPRDTLRNYTDRHTHINLPNQRRYYWDAPTGGCNK